MNKLGTYLKNIFLFLILLQLIPFFIKSFKSSYDQFFKPKTRVGVIPIQTSITKSQPLLKHIRALYKDDSVKAILLTIDSGGGTAGTAQTIFDELVALKKETLKPTIAFVENLCASGAYYVACAADIIIAPRAAFIGSIGVYIPQPQLHEFLEQFKIHYSVVKTGTYKTAGDPFLPANAKNTELLKSLTDSTYNQFVSDVIKQRARLTEKTQDGWAQGKLFTGEQALEIGLIDQCGSFSDVEKAIKEKAPIEGEIEWIRPPKQSRLARLLGAEQDSTNSEAASSWISDTLATTIKKVITTKNYDNKQALTATC